MAKAGAEKVLRRLVEGLSRETDVNMVVQWTLVVEKDVGMGYEPRKEASFSLISSPST